MQPFFVKMNKFTTQMYNMIMFNMSKHYVEDTIERKRIKGPRNPLNNEEYDDGVVNVVADQFEELLRFEEAYFEEEYELFD
uniref:Uncharacterized protein n=1 Tax=Acrobeloides nanus TaxID=290746 RepID=A0A914BW73_9BILA